MSNARKATGTRASSVKKAQPPPKPTLDDLLGEASRPERTVPICLRGHLQAEWDRLQAEYAAGPGDDDKAMLTDRAAKRKVADQIAALEAEMRAGTVEFRLRALPRRRTPDMPEDAVVWQELFDKFPPRKDANGKVDPRDVHTGCDVLALAEELIPASIVDPAVSPAQWAKLSSVLNDGEWNRLATAAWELNRSGVDVPFSLAASMMRRLDAASRRRSGSGSPYAGSTGGSRSGSRSTPTTKAGG